MSRGLAVRTARSAEEVEGLRSVWSSFGAEVASADIDYRLMLVERRPEAVRPQVLLVESEGAPAALVVGRVEDIGLPAKLGYKSLWRPRLRALTVSYGGVLGQEDEQTAEAMLGEVPSALRRGEADVARLRNRPVRPNLTRTALLASDRAASAMLRRRDQLPLVRRLPRRQAEAWR